MAVMKASEFVAKLKDVAQNYKTLYVMGCFGAPRRAAMYRGIAITTHTTSRPPNEDD